MFLEKWFEFAAISQALFVVLADIHEKSVALKFLHQLRY
jgi:hypothetical protein